MDDANARDTRTYGVVVCWYCGYEPAVHEVWGFIDLSRPTPRPYSYACRRCGVGRFITSRAGTIAGLAG